MGSQVKKRHRRTKTELLMDPVYCAKHGIKYVKGEIKKPILTPEKKKRAKKEVKKEEPKKRHRRTKAELLKDPAYRKKHHLDDPKLTNLASLPAVKKPRKPKKDDLPKNQAIAEIEEEWMTKMYKHWEDIQSCMSGMEMELCDFLKKKQGKLGLQEFDSLDYNLGQMENRFQDFDQAIDRRRRME